MGSFLITRIRQARRSYHDALVEVQRATAAKHRLQVSGDTGVVNRPTHQCHVLTKHISHLLRQPHTQGVIGKEHKLAEAEAALGRAQQGVEEAKRAYEVAWRWEMLEQAWQQIKVGTHEPWDELLRHIALGMAQRLNTDDSKRLCKLLELGKVAPKDGLQQWVKDIPDAHMALQLLVMFNDVGYSHYYEQHSPDQANKGLKLVAAQYEITPETVQSEVKKAIRAAQKATKAAAKAAEPSSADAPAAQASGVRGGGTQNETSKGRNAGKRKAASKAPAAPALTPEEAIQGIAAAMQREEAGAESGPEESDPVGGAAAEGLEERPTADEGPAGESGGVVWPFPDVERAGA